MFIIVEVFCLYYGELLQRNVDQQSKTTWKLLQWVCYGLRRSVREPQNEYHHELRGVHEHHDQSHTKKRKLLMIKKTMLTFIVRYGPFTLAYNAIILFYMYPGTDALLELQVW